MSVSNSVFRDRIMKNLPIFILIMVSTLTIDVVVSNTADFITDFVASWQGQILFIAIVLLNLTFQLMLIEYFVRMSKNNFLNKRRLRLVGIIQYMLISTNVTIIIQILTANYYHTFFLILNTSISYLFAAAMFLFSGIKLLNLFKINRNRMLFLYSISFFSLTAFVLSSVILMDYLISLRPNQILPSTPVVYPGFEDQSLEKKLSDYYVLFDIISFTILWLSTAVTMYYYSTRLGKIKFWVLTGLPLLFFYSNFFDLIPGLEFFDDFSYITVTSIHAIAGGLLFSLVFWFSSRNVNNEELRKYLRITSFGFILWFSCVQASTISASYPPFGMISVSLISLSSVFISIGLYYCILSSARDSSILRKMSKSSKEELIMLKELAHSHYTDSLMKTINRLEKNTTDLEVVSPDSSLTIEEIRDHIDYFIKAKKENETKS